MKKFFSPALRANPGLASVPIIAVTSDARAGARTKTLAAGGKDCREKPGKPGNFVTQNGRFLLCRAEGGPP